MKKLGLQLFDNRLVFIGTPCVYYGDKSCSMTISN